MIPRRMGIYNVSLLHAVLTLIVLALGTVAQECTRSHNYTVSTQDELNTVTRNCTEITGELSLLNWSGSLTLQNITRLQSLVLHSGSSVTSLDLPELEFYAGNLILTGLPELSRVSAPRLEVIDALHVGFSGDEPVLEIPRLVNASSVFLRGNFQSQSFNALRYVRTKFDICNAINCENFSYMNATTSMDLSFPALQHVGNLQIGGNVTRLSTPEVTAVTCSECDWAALHLKLFGASPVAVDFPKLRTIEGNTYIRGDLASISFPVLHDYTHEFIAIPHQPLTISIPLETGENFLFTGNITELNLPNLRDFNRIHVDSDISDFDCDGLWEGIKQTHSTPLNESYADAYFQCSLGVSFSRGTSWVGTAGIVFITMVAVGFVL
ncbi:hypothetical protein BJX70DRAFT_382447 [Aspergillus crustosus]